VEDVWAEINEASSWAWLPRQQRCRSASEKVVIVVARTAAVQGRQQVGDPMLFADGAQGGSPPSSSRACFRTTMVQGAGEQEVISGLIAG
jgi:hypothetical protein